MTGSGVFTEMHLEQWRQFRHVHIDFHDRLTILTGANASGKTTILSLLAKHFAWNKTFLSASVKGKGEPVYRLDPAVVHPYIDTETSAIGSVAYHDRTRSNILIPLTERSAPQYEVSLQPLRNVEGLYVPSHRSAPNYAPVPQIPTRFAGASALFEQFTNDLRSRHIGQPTNRSPILSMKESLISAALFGEGNSSVQPNPAAADVWLGFQKVLGKLLPASLGFKRLTVRMPEVLMQTDTGEFPIDDASGGLAAIMELAWQVFLRSRAEKSFVVIIDEPENHLHPSLQRRVMPDLMAAFPHVQFIVATHSPLVVTAVADSKVFVLDYAEDDTQPTRGPVVDSRELDFVNRAGTAEETLQRVLGLESSLPLWAEEAFNAVMATHIKRGMAKEDLSSLRSELRRLGLANTFPNALAALTESDVSSSEKS